VPSPAVYFACVRTCSPCRSQRTTSGGSLRDLAAFVCRVRLQRAATGTVRRGRGRGRGRGRDQSVCMSLFLSFSLSLSLSLSHSLICSDFDSAITLPLSPSPSPSPSPSLSPSLPLPIPLLSSVRLFPTSSHPPPLHHHHLSPLTLHPSLPRRQLRDGQALRRGREPGGQHCVYRAPGRGAAGRCARTAGRPSLERPLRRTRKGSTAAAGRSKGGHGESLGRGEQRTAAALRSLNAPAPGCA